MFIFFDSETSTLDGVSWPIAYGYIIADDRLKEVERGIVRTAEDMTDVILRAARKTKKAVYAYSYNLFFDLHPLLDVLSYKFTFNFFAKTEYNWISVDCLDAQDRRVIRFCDLRALQDGGLKVCGDIAGIPKLSGDFDFSKVRSTETPLTEEEQGYIMRDVEIMPAYLRKIRELFGIPFDFFGSKIVTTSQLAREKARQSFDGLLLGRGQRTPEVLQKICASAEAAPNEDILLLRRACNRGGLVFINAALAGKEVEGVDFYDFTSAYHFFIQSARVPVGFKKADKETLNSVFKHVLERPVGKVMAAQTRAFLYYFHAEIEVTNIRLKECFRERGIGSFSRSKMAVVNLYNEGMASTVKVQEKDREKRRDKTWKGVFCFEKLIEAERARLHVTEQELYIMGLFYEWDSLEIIEGEFTQKTINPPDWQALRSCLLYEQKRDYNAALIDGDADAFARIKIKPDELSERGAVALYRNVKTEVNTLFGELVRELRAPAWKELGRDIDAPELTLKKVPPYNGKEYGLFNQGMRVSGGARLQLAILIYYALSKGCEVVYGDTDSIAVIDNEEGSFAKIARLLSAAREEQNKATSTRIEEHTGEYFDLEGVGTLQKNAHYQRFCATRPKTWGGLKDNGKVTLRASGADLDKLAQYMEETPDILALSEVLGWNTVYSFDFGKRVARQYPELYEQVEVSGTDYRGARFTDLAPRAVTLTDERIKIGNSRLHLRDLDFLKKIGNEQKIEPAIVARSGVHTVADLPPRR